MGVMGLDPVLLLLRPPTELCIPTDADADADAEGGVEDVEIIMGRLGRFSFLELTGRLMATLPELPFDLAVVPFAFPFPCARATAFKFNLVPEVDAKFNANVDGDPIVCISPAALLLNCKRPLRLFFSLDNDDGCNLTGAVDFRLFPLIFLEGVTVFLFLGDIDVVIDDDDDATRIVLTTRGVGAFFAKLPGLALPLLLLLLILLCIDTNFAFALTFAAMCSVLGGVSATITCPALLLIFILLLLLAPAPLLDPVPTPAPTTPDTFPIRGRDVCGPGRTWAVMRV
mmetsp:Transcript_22312/g.32949  ORF Transcript_22312/g.32949 Transcript_22312/m.32949 type:complete len:285 (+) Transcript_22312:2071-2925(+)